jgi:Ran GTPase-activating protein (RanGAP) involved in mRNA processing and transport
LHFDISDNDIKADGGKALVEALKGNQVITTLSIAKNNLSVNSSGDNDMSGVVALADAIPGMRALSSANLLGNQILVEQAHELVAIMQSKEKLTTLCGFSREEATLGVSNQGLGPGDAVLIANDISDMRALTVLDISKNSLHGEGARQLAKALHGSNLTDLNTSGSRLNRVRMGSSDADVTGVVAIANAIKDMGLIHCQCNGQPHRQGDTLAAPGDHALQTESCFSVRHHR